MFVSPKALVELYGDDGSVKGEWRVGRNASNMVEFLKSNFSNDQVVGLFLVEDEDSSDPPPEGEERLRMPLFPDADAGDGSKVPMSRMRVQDAISALVSAVTPDPDIVRQFRMDCEMATIRSGMDCAILTFVFGGRPAGFVFLNSCKDVPVSSLGTLYEAARSQVDRMKREFRELAPGIVFSDDPVTSADGRRGVVLPDGTPASGAGAGRIVTPSEAADEMDRAGVTRVVEVV